MNRNELLLSVVGVGKSYPMGSSFLDVVHSIDLDIEVGEALCVMGASGAGKSTLLHIMGTLDRPTKGRVFYKGVDLFSKNEDYLAAFRNEKMGFVFQFHHLLAEFTALENVMMPCRIAGQSIAESRKKAESLIEEVGMGDRKNHFPNELSGGEKQRVAIARALVRGPEILFADEPTGNLDSTNGERIQNLFFDLKVRKGLTVVCVTHDQLFAKRFPRLQSMKDGSWVTG
jgi:lipoprotein-releasing system ATP-binding protein